MVWAILLVIGRSTPVNLNFLSQHSLISYISTGGIFRNALFGPPEAAHSIGKFIGPFPQGPRKGGVGCRSASLSGLE